MLGLGVLGNRIIDALRGFDFPINGWSRTQKNRAGVHCYAGLDQLDQFLQASKVLVVILPLTIETEDLLDRAKLAQLPRGSYLINVARGAHLIEADLLALIQEGHIAGATLDVFRQEPLPPEHPFWAEPRISITPHISALTMRDESARQIATKIQALQKGLPIVGVVDQKRGY